MTEPAIELVYERTCPNVAAARALIAAACAQQGLAPRWREWETGDPQLPAHARGFGSPTILVDGVDVTGQTAGATDCCRLYPGNEGLRGVPELAQLLQSLRRAKERSG